MNKHYAQNWLNNLKEFWFGKDIEIELLAIDSYTVIAEWFLKQNNQEYDEIYEIKFNDNLECIYYFKSWEMIK